MGRIVYNTSYGFIWILLRLAITAPIITPLSILAAYFYISFMASNLYSTHLLKLMLVMKMLRKVSEFFNIVADAISTIPPEALQWILIILLAPSIVLLILPLLLSLSGLM